MKRPRIDASDRSTKRLRIVPGQTHAATMMRAMDAIATRTTAFGLSSGANQARPKMVAARAIIPERDMLTATDTLMTSAARPVSSVLAPSLEDSARNRAVQSG